jgi:hypothetical protein
LLSRQIDPVTVLVAHLFPDDPLSLTAILILPDRRVWRVDLEYPPELDERTAMKGSQVIELTEDVDEMTIALNQGFISAALNMLGGL